MGGVVDDCGLRFVQRRHPSKYPRFWGSNGLFRKNTGKKAAGVRLYSALYALPLLFPLGYTPKTPEHQKSALKKTQGGRRGRDRPRRAIAPFFGTLEKTKSPVPWAFLVRDFEGAGPVGV